MGCMNGRIQRRTLLRGLAGLAAAGLLPGARARADCAGFACKAFPSTGFGLPVIGLGSWLTFDVGAAPARRENVRRVIEAFFERGGAMIDSSPMYLTSQEVIGDALAKLSNDQNLFSATKVWIPGRRPGIWQMERSLEQWGVDHFDLLYVHNLVDWEKHLPWMREWQAQGRATHIGVTTSHGRRHDELLEVLGSEKMDCVQFTYNIRDREAEQRLLPFARDRGLAVVINRPFAGGALFRGVRGRPLPPWASEIRCENWAQFFLKFIVSHPAVTCVIPATTRVEHLHENMGALDGPLPDAAMRALMLRHYDSL